jgi:hypothetical protein
MRCIIQGFQGFQGGGVRAESRSLPAAVRRYRLERTHYFTEMTHGGL